MHPINVLKSSFLSVVFIGMSINAVSQNINTPENFPDPNFRAAVEEFMGVAPGGEILEADISRKGGMFDCSSRGIADLTGIERFPAINTLVCSQNQLTRLDISHNKSLTGLWCNENQLASLNVSGATALLELACGMNQLTSLDVSQNTQLAHLGCSWNRLANLDVTNNPALYVLVCDNNRLIELDVSKNPKLASLDCGKNEISVLDVSQNTALKTLECIDNQLTSLSSFIANEGLGRNDWVDVRYNYIDCGVPEAITGELQILAERIGETLLYEPQKECLTAVLDWGLY